VFRRCLVLALTLLVLRAPLDAQDAPALQIRVEEGDGLTYPIGSRATRGITIVVADAAGKPVAGAAVTFRLPDAGPGGEFSNGSKTEIVTTRADGRASVWGMKWNGQAGAFDVRITATKGQTRAGTVCSQHLTEAPGPSVTKGGSSHRWLWIALAVGAAGAGAAIAARGHSGSSNCSATVVLLQNPCASSPSSLGTTQIGTPTIALGTP
jgi:hypothetical protein